ncbi:MAG TPA: nitroreductase/quinone reductase family protein [Candidatus Limnocylindrales bacterium]|nr:nitroreductase/quinone reductase family protein [Candidatus Limnocylindrales bacterium]
MKKALFVVAATVTAIGAFVQWWRRHPRAGAATVNRLINPWLVRQGVADASRGEIGLMEHVGRTSGTVRVTPVHPVPTETGFRIIVPLGNESQWARNVLAAGHCRLQVGETIHELDEPRLVLATQVEELPRAAAATADWLGFRYLLLHQFAERPGTLVTPDATLATLAMPVPPEPAGRPEPEPEAPQPDLVPTA